MSRDEARLDRGPEVPSTPAAVHLSRQDIDRLTNYKWRYSLEAHGFSSTEAGRLLFVKWLHGQGGLSS